jgi:hypothetical protein
MLRSPETGQSSDRAIRGADHLAREDVPGVFGPDTNTRDRPKTKHRGRHGFEAFTNARGVLYHSARIDPCVKYPPYSEHTREREVMDKLM